MSNRHAVSDAISNYYFQQILPRTASQRVHHPVGKENVGISNRHIHQPQLKFIQNLRNPLHNMKASSPNRPSFFNSIKPVPSSQTLQKEPFPNKIVSYASSVERNVPRQKRSDSVTSNKKSVKFAERVEGIQSAKSLLSNRPRSNSILKTRSMSKDFNKSRPAGQLRHVVSSDRFYIHRNAGIKNQYKQIIGQPVRDVKLRVMSSNSSSSLPFKHNKYIDPAFSLHLPRINNNALLMWKRLSQMSQFSSAVIRGRAEESSKVKIAYHAKECYNLSVMLNMIRNCRQLLDFVLEDLKINDKGAFLLKIFQENQWKYIIIDDFFPAQIRDNSPQLAFIGAAGNGRRQIWPLLVQKAYAAYLGSFDRLHQFSLSLLFSDLLRLPTQTHLVTQSLINNLSPFIYNQADSQFIIYAEKSEPSDGLGIYSSLKIVKNHQRFQILQQNEDSSFSVIKIPDFLTKYKELTKVTIPNFQTFSSVDVISSNNIGRQIKNRYLNSQNIASDMGYGQMVSKITAKSFIIQKMAHCDFIIKAYDKGLQRKGHLWSRVLLFQRQVDGYRWIAGKYSNTIISLSCVLEPGKYYMLFIPDRRQESSLQFTVTAYSKHTPIKFQPQPDAHIASMIEKGCSDLAQRTGKMTQVNKWICTYTLVEPEAAIIVQNINNERRNGSIRIFRTIKNLKTHNCQLLPLNKEFYQGNRLRDQAEIMIEKEGSASVILFLCGGFDAQFFKHFNFGL